MKKKKLLSRKRNKVVCFRVRVDGQKNPLRVLTTLINERFLLPRNDAVSYRHFPSGPSKDKLYFTDSSTFK